MALLLFACSLGDNLLHLIENSSDPHVFRLHRDRVFFLRWAGFTAQMCESGLRKCNVVSLRLELASVCALQQLHHDL